MKKKILQIHAVSKKCRTIQRNGRAWKLKKEKSSRAELKSDAVINFFGQLAFEREIEFPGFLYW